MGKSKEENIRDMGVINKGQTLVIINGGHGLMGGRYPLGAIQTDDLCEEFS